MPCVVDGCAVVTGAVVCATMHAVRLDPSTPSDVDGDDRGCHRRCTCLSSWLTRVLQGCPPLLFVLYCLNSFIESFPLTAYGVWLNEEIQMPLDMQSRFYACIFLPWCLKPVYGWISVNYPIRGQGKRPYIIICSLGSAIMYIVTATLVQTYTSAFLVRLEPNRLHPRALPRRRQ